MPQTASKAQLFTAFIAGTLLTTAFAPIGAFPMAIVAPAILMALWQPLRPKSAAWVGWWFGVGLFSTGMSWIYISIHRFGETNIPLAVAITALFVAYLSLYPAITGYCFNRYFPRDNPARNWLALPVIWVFCEFLRGWVGTGFPWLFVGYTQMHVFAPLRGFAPIVGVYGVGFLVILSSGLLRDIVRGKHRLLALVLGAALWCGGAVLTKMQWTHPVGETIKASLVQGNIPQSLKWQPEQVNPTLETYTQLSKQHTDSDLIVWPEGAIPVSLNDALQFTSEVTHQLQAQGTTLYTGIAVDAVEPGRYYNAIVGLGVNRNMYFKRHLVPFGEYLPFDKQLRGLINLFDIPMSDFIVGPMQQSQLRLGDLSIAPFICYEIAYPRLAWNSIKGSDLLLTISENAWFGDSLELGQMLQMAEMRSLETGRQQLMATNDGITAFINEKGETTHIAPKFKATVLTSTAQPMQGITPIMHIGVWPLLFGMIALLAFAKIWAE